MIFARVVSLLVIAVSVVGCGASDPDAALKQLLADAEIAAEARDTGFFRDLIAPSYRDSRGNDRDQMVNLIRGYFLTNTTIEMVTMIDEIKLQGADAARVELRAGMVAQRAGASLLGGLGGDLHRVRLELIKDDSDWRIIGVNWQPAEGK